jgi:hypothetical protein
MTSPSSPSSELCCGGTRLRRGCVYHDPADADMLLGGFAFRSGGINVFDDGQPGMRITVLRGTADAFKLIGLYNAQLARAYANPTTAAVDLSYAAAHIHSNRAWFSAPMCDSNANQIFEVRWV